jgi:sec-independent protein translocase protein TatB
VFNLSGSEIIVILLLALVVLGPEKLPDALRKAGKTYSELKKMGSSFQSEMRSALDEPMKEMQETADLLRRSADIGAKDIDSGPAPASSPTARTTRPTPTPEPRADEEAAAPEAPLAPAPRDGDEATA